MDEATHRRLHETIVRLADGDRAVFPRLFAELRPLLVRFVGRALDYAPDAEDVAQRVLINIFFRIAEFDTSRDGVAWAFGIAAWEVRTHLRRVSRRRETPLVDPPASVDASSASPENLTIQRSLEDALHEALDALSPSERAALVVQHADARGRTPATPAERKRRQRALARLRAIWGQRYE
jgi:RNA polymerase sigma factor (sigma-70 family)